MATVERRPPARRPVYLDLFRIRMPMPSVISILHRISGVVRGGRYLGPADLGALKEKVAAARSAR